MTLIKAYYIKITTTKALNMLLLGLGESFTDIQLFFCVFSIYTENT